MDAALNRPGGAPGPEPGAVDCVAVFDMGKTHAKLSIVDARTGELLSQARRANEPVLRGGWKQLDLAATEQWLLGELAASPQRGRIDLLVPVAHGAACVLVDRQGDVLIAPDYEDPAFDALTADYDRQRDAFAATGSPRLPAGLNLGAQWHALEQAEPGLWAAAMHTLLLPQYWAWRWSGLAACEVSSLGVHTDLWQPVAAQGSQLARRRGWIDRLPPLRRADTVLGCIRAALARATGLPPACRVLCGLHDSNAAWLAQRSTLARRPDLTLLSTGTWLVAMNAAVAWSRLHEDRDMLANVDVLGRPLPTARFMGGREFAAACGAGAAAALPAAQPEDLASVLARRAMALPTFMAGSGPFARSPGQRVGMDGLTPSQTRAAATLYLALVTDVMLDLLDAAGPVVVDGPLATDALYAGVLQALRPAQAVRCTTGSEGVVLGALALLSTSASTPVRRGAHTDARPAPAVQAPDLAGYRADWRAAIARAALAPGRQR